MRAATGHGLRIGGVAAIAAIPLVYFNKRWIGCVNGAADRLLARPSWAGTATAKLPH
jgi:hypothetical protein